jgi:hypothetical protein
MADDPAPDIAGALYPPFREDWWYQGQTYAGHSDYAVDWNRRTRTGGWLDDRGDPVLAAADGTVAEVTVEEGYVAINHFGGTTRTEYRHMQPVVVKVGQKVRRGDRIGDIGEAGNAPNGTHLHHRHYRRERGAWEPVKMAILGTPIRVSVASDDKPAGWSPPPPVMVQGVPGPVTWEATAKALRRALADQKAQTALATEERDLARREVALLTTTVAELRTALTAAEKRITELENATPDCSEAESKLADIRAVLDR